MAFESFGGARRSQRQTEPSRCWHIAQNGGQRSRSDAVEKKVPTKDARHARWGMPVLLVLVCGLILAGIAWLGVEIYGQKLADEPAAMHINND
jgi:hypothetical protein